MAGAPDQAVSGGEGGHRRRLDLLLFLGIFLVALVIRLVYLAQQRAVVFFDLPIGDAAAYWNWAQRIVGGDWSGSGVFYQAPLYPYFLALARLFVGDSFLGVHVVQAVVGAAAAGVLFGAARQFVSRAAAVLAGLLLAVYPPAIFYDGLIQKTVLDGLWLMLLLWAVGAGQRRPGVWRWFLAGACLGLLILTRENALSLVPVLAIWLLVKFARRPRAARLKWLAALGGGLAVALLPVALRNLFVGGQFALTTAQAGPNFFIGNNPDANGSYVPLRPGRGEAAFEQQDAVELAEQAAHRRLTPREVSRYWFARGWSFIRENPGASWTLTLRKLAWTLSAYEIPDTEDLAFYQEYCSLLRGLGPWWHFGVLLPLAVGGVVLTGARWRDLSVLYALLASFVVSVVLFFVLGRYRYPLVPVLMVFSGAWLVEGWRLLRAREFRELAFAGIMVSLAAVVANRASGFPERYQVAISHSNAGNTLLFHDRLEEARQHFEQAIAIEPRAFEAHYGLGRTLARLNRLDDAIAALETALRLAPQVAAVEAALGATLVARGDAAAGERRLRHALSVGREDPETVGSLGRACLAQGRWQEALQLLRRSVELAPGDRRFLLELAWALATCPDAALRNAPEAVRLAETACTPGRGDSADGLDVLAAAYAAAGRFSEAVAVGRRAVESARATAGVHSASAIQARLGLYERGQPFVLRP